MGACCGKPQAEDDDPALSKRGSRKQRALSGGAGDGAGSSGSADQRDWVHDQSGTLCTCPPLLATRVSARASGQLRGWLSSAQSTPRGRKSDMVEESSCGPHPMCIVCGFESGTV
jgi:hypothetical protein